MTARHTLSLDNLRLLQQGVALLESIDDDLYVHRDTRLSDSCVGSHLRHCIDFYHRFLGGVYSGKVDYDKRERDPRLEEEREYAIAELSRVTKALEAFGDGPDGMALEVQSDAGTGDAGHWAASSVERELQVLASHTVHHYALIAVILRSAGHDPGREFGVAPSTLRYWEETGRVCTVSWIPGSTSFELFSNRDERRTRAREVAPQEYELAGVRYLAPLDSEAGGTWIVVNEFGLALCLLNNYQARFAPEAADARSRGLLVKALADAESLEELSLRTPAEDLARYRGFRLLGLQAGHAPRLVEWDGAVRTEHVGPNAPLVSSSVDLDGATDTRHASYEGVASTRAAHLAFHASHADGPGPRSVCMHRPDAATRSLTHVRVDAAEVVMRHAAGAPCDTPLGDELRLARRAPLSVGF